MFWVGAVLRRRVIRGRKRMGVLRSPGEGEGATMGTGTHPASVATAAILRTSLRPGFAYTRAYRISSIV